MKCEAWVYFTLVAWPLPKQKQTVTAVDVRTVIARNLALAANVYEQEATGNPNID